MYTAKAPTRGVEARLYAPMVAGVGLALGCFITGFTALANVHWIASCIGQAIAVGESVFVPTNTSRDNDNIRDRVYLRLRLLRNVRLVCHCRPVHVAQHYRRAFGVCNYARA